MARVVCAPSPAPGGNCPTGIDKGGRGPSPPNGPAKEKGRGYFYQMSNMYTCVGFVAAAVSMPMGGCRAIRPRVVDVVSVTVEPAVL